VTDEWRRDPYRKLIIPDHLKAEFDGVEDSDEYQALKAVAEASETLHSQQVRTAAAAHASRGELRAVKDESDLYQQGFRLGVEQVERYLKDVLAESILNDQDDTSDLVKLLIKGIRQRFL
jgi:hypothetical protein